VLFYAHYQQLYESKLTIAISVRPEYGDAVPVIAVCLVPAIFDSLHDSVMSRAEQTPGRRLLASSTPKLESTAKYPGHGRHQQIDGCEK
jgi:hypothetical protein